MTHRTPSRVACSLVIMSGMAMFTIVRSSRVMKNPSDMTMRTTHGLPRYLATMTKPLLVGQAVRSSLAGAARDMSWRLPLLARPRRATPWLARSRAGQVRRAMPAPSTARARSHARSRQERVQVPAIRFASRVGPLSGPRADAPGSGAPGPDGRYRSATDRRARAAAALAWPVRGRGRGPGLARPDRERTWRIGDLPSSGARPRAQYAPGHELERNGSNRLGRSKRPRRGDCPRPGGGRLQGRRRRSQRGARQRASGGGRRGLRQDRRVGRAVGAAGGRRGRRRSALRCGSR